MMNIAFRPISRWIGCRKKLQSIIFIAVAFCVQAGENQGEYSGIVRGFTIGAGGYSALGQAKRYQSPFGFDVRALYPTGERSQVRLSVGIPLNWNFAYEKGILAMPVEPLISLEHDWGWRHIGVTAGIAFMQLMAFERKDYHLYFRRHDYDADGYSYYQYSISEEFAAASAFNAVAAFRFGKPNAGFRGRISWPMAFTIQYAEAKQYYLDYSGFAVFGSHRAVCGIGFQGMYKHRERTPGTLVRSDTSGATADKYNAYSYREAGVAKQFSLLVPCTRIAWRITDHLLIDLTLELGGTVLPRFLFTPFSGTDNTSGLNWWLPSAGFGITYSLGKLSGAHVHDGRM